MYLIMGTHAVCSQLLHRVVFRFPEYYTYLAIVMCLYVKGMRVGFTHARPIMLSILVDLRVGTAAFVVDGSIKLCMLFDKFVSVLCVY